MSVGDVASDARGSGARFNDGKPDLSLIPLRLLAESTSFVIDADCGTDAQREAVEALEHVGLFQETGDREHLEFALFALGDHWRDCARVFEYGRKKYAAWNWAKGMAWSIPIACLGRHCLAILEGEDDDPESTLPHLGHVLCNLVMLAQFTKSYPEGNDLPPSDYFKETP